MLRGVTIFICLLLCGAAARATPKITEKTGVRTLASVTDRTALARGSVFEVTGEGLGPSDQIAADVPYPLDLAGVSVKLTSSGDASAGVDAFVVSASALRIVAIVPSAVAEGSYLVTVTVNGEISNSFPVRITNNSFGLITDTGATGGMSRGRVIADGANPVPITLFAGVAPGATVELDAAGLGPIETADNEFSPEANLFPDAAVLIGDLTIPVIYLGRNPSAPGYDKLVFTIPAENVTFGCSASARVRIGESSTLAFALPLLALNESVCRSPLNISPDGLTALANGGSIIKGGFTLVRLTGQTTVAGLTFDTREDRIDGGFYRYTADAIPILVAQRQAAGAFDQNGCVVVDATDSVAGVYVDAGPSLRLVDPSWNVTVPRGTGPSLNQYNLVLDSKVNNADSPFLPTPKLPFTPGRHTLSGPGGTVIAPFSVDITVSNELRWTNMTAVTEIDTSKELTLLFSGGGADDIVAGSGLVRGPAPEAPAKIVNRTWVCLAKASAGRIVVPSSILRQLPRVSAAELANPASGRSSFVSVGNYNPAGTGNFTAPLTEGGRTELIDFVFSYTSSKYPVSVR